MGFLLSWYFLVPLLFAAILFVYIGRVRHLPLLRSKKASRVSWKEIQDYAGVPSALLVLLLGWWLVSRGSEAPWSFGSAMRTPQFLVGLFLFIVLIATYLLAVHKDFEKRFSRRVLTAIAIVSGLLLMAWATIPRTRVLWASLMQPAPRPVRVAAAAPAPRLKIGVTPCLTGAKYPSIPLEQAARDEVVEQSDSSLLLHWTAAEPVFGLASFLVWPEGVDTLELRVEHVGGRLGVNSWLTDTGEQARFVEVTEPPGSWYCPDRLDEYPFQTLLHHLGPLQTALIVNPEGPNPIVFPFSRGRIAVLRVTRTDNVVLVFNNPNRGGTRLLRATFRVSWSPAL